MCVIALAWNAHRRWRLVLVGNRDESHVRPSAALAHWPHSAMIAGRDLEAGGTWLGVTAAGRCSVVTNVRDPNDSQAGLSRGLLITDYLAGEVDAASYATTLQLTAAEYRPFNLLVFDGEHAFHVGNRPHASLQALSNGVHGLSNATLDTPWPKTRRLCDRLEGWLTHEDSARDNFDALFAALADEQTADDGALPDTGIGLELERRLSSAFIRGASYGTRASTVVALAHDGGGVIIERRFGPGGRSHGETILPIINANANDISF